LRRHEGVPIGSVHDNAEDRLYDLLSRANADLAHARYAAYLEQVVSFADACRLVRRRRAFVPPLSGSEDRHVFIEAVGRVSFYHYDPYAQLLSKVVRGFARDLIDAKALVTSGMVDPERFQKLVEDIPEASYSKYPRLSSPAVRAAVEDFLSGLRP
jgi:hypothetical protein